MSRMPSRRHGCPVWVGLSSFVSRALVLLLISTLASSLRTLRVLIPSHGTRVQARPRFVPQHRWILLLLDRWKPLLWLHPLLRLLFSLLSEVLLLLLLLRALLGRERRQHRGGIVRRVSPLHPHLLLLLLHRLLLRDPSPSSFSSYHPSYYRSRLQRIVAMEESRGADAAGIHHRLPRRLAEGARSATVAEGRPPGADTGSYHPADARMVGRGGADRRTERRGRHGSLAHDPEPPGPIAGVA